ncbi:FtsK/SpoIIIE domain-containing protein [Staphylococcus equorum]|uniref:FtsK domain-containing protein n=1 Tax=Staphylococcus equorum TaxID=246432 RepID=A0AAP7LUZ9_9STAP|nr:FtsK/SpoIIIE domain-containing protein [Staphylococcus equorum]OEK58864.1 hypothetical protein ASS94_00655 [Staphylococcus equorum]
MFFTKRKEKEKETQAIVDISVKETQAIVGISMEGKAIRLPLSQMEAVTLVAGVTGSGKTIFHRSLLTTILATSKPDKVKFLIADPKRNDYLEYFDMPFMLRNPIGDSKDVIDTLEDLKTEMDKRHQLFNHGGYKDLDVYNEAVERGETKDGEKLPHIVFLIDEINNVMWEYKEKMEDSIKYFGAKARASGIHLVLSTQFAKKEYIDGAIKLNANTKITLRTSNKIESMVALGEYGAEKLQRQGEFYASINGDKTMRGHVPYIDDDEIDKIFGYIKSNEKASRDVSFPLTLFKNRKLDFEEERRNVEKYGNTMQRKIEKLMPKYIGSDIKIRGKKVLSRTVAFEYKRSQHPDGMPNLEKVEKALETDLNEDVEGRFISVTLKGRNIVIIMPLPEKYHMPIDIKTMIEEAFE